MRYNENKNIQITFTIRESYYFKFKTYCKNEKKMPATVLKELIMSYVEKKEIENGYCSDPGQKALLVTIFYFSKTP